MKGIGGNTKASIQVYMASTNEIGENVKDWKEIQVITGWLDLQAGDSKYTSFNAKMQESTHVFVAEYVPLAEGREAENSRMVINGKRYDVMLIDNPMELNEQWEIYLKFTGGQ